MATTGSRVGTALVFLAVGGVVGYLIGSAGPTPPGGTKTVFVGPTAKDVNPSSITIGPADTVFWRTTTNTPVAKSLKIVFPRAKYPTHGIPPFENMASQGTESAAHCGSNTCSSGRVNPALPPGRHTYRYDQILSQSGQPDDHADGWIIIQR